MSIKCPGCKGIGKAHLFKDRDVIEGYKLATLYYCFMCDGKGNIETSNSLEFEACEAYWLIYNKHIDKQKQDIILAKNKREKLIKSAKSKLTPEELKALVVKDMES